MTDWVIVPWSGHGTFALLHGETWAWAEDSQAHVGMKVGPLREFRETQACTIFKPRTVFVVCGVVNRDRK